MTFTVKPISDDNRIFLIEYPENTTPEDVVESVRTMIAMAKDAPRPVYQLGDWRKVHGNLGIVIKIMQVVPQIRKLNEEAGVVGPYIINHLTNPWLRLARDLGKKIQFGNFSMPVFEDEAAAVQYIHEIAESTKQPTS